MFRADSIVTTTSVHEHTQVGVDRVPSSETVFKSTLTTTVSAEQVSAYSLLGIYDFSTVRLHLQYINISASLWW